MKTDYAASKDKDAYKTIHEIARKYGYPFEKHIYITADNYINSVFRISGPKGTNPIENARVKAKKPVLLYQHGVLDSGAGICLDGPDSMAFFFADLGFDVWLNNSRGNRFSRDHKFLNPKSDDEYWNFSFHELGIYD